ncbi:MAG TPA: methylmalonyl-CoA epimerase [Candidatus Limnocylindrales bacterium]|nr:methylmalonyl-CoA epimerase [Candidatus Limnocylindrales bacterium]
MDRSSLADLHARLAPEGGGGVIDAVGAIDATALAGVANEHGARFVHLAGPSTKRGLLETLASEMTFPGWAGRNWDALEELLAHPEASMSGGILIAWTDPGRLDAADAGTFRAIVTAAAATRSQGGDAPLVAVIGTTNQEVSPMSEVPPSIRRLGKIHHVALIVRSIEDALGLWRDMLGLELETITDISSDRVRIAFLGVGESKVELVQPTDDTTGVARFLASKGEGFHHVCFEVPNLAEAIIRLELDGLELIDTVPRRGVEGPVAFIHPRSCHGVLVELIEAPGGPAWTSLGFGDGA